MGGKSCFLTIWTAFSSLVLTLVLFASVLVITLYLLFNFIFYIFSFLECILFRQNAFHPDKTFIVVRALKVIYLTIYPIVFTL